MDPHDDGHRGREDEGDLAQRRDRDDDVVQHEQRHGQETQAERARGEQDWILYRVLELAKALVQLPGPSNHDGLCRGQLREPSVAAAEDMDLLVVRFHCDRCHMPGHDEDHHKQQHDVLHRQNSKPRIGELLLVRHRQTAGQLEQQGARPQRIFEGPLQIHIRKSEHHRRRIDHQQHAGQINGLHSPGVVPTTVLHGEEEHDADRGEAVRTNQQHRVGVPYDHLWDDSIPISRIEFHCWPSPTPAR
mmetsp:Transcript_1095/g.4560  ORF Transcript_1095/g.4560 Transcript_1095/m.4560 type:complete len:246 (-) Transcript_1095:185-922(-)